MSSVPDRSVADVGPGDPYAHWDAAYVLGALAPAERLEFEEHLAGCDRCRGAVAELAGLPGLLSQVAPEDAAALIDPPPSDGPAGSAAVEARMPEHLLPEVLAQVRGRRTRLSRALLGLAAAVLLVLAGFLLGGAVRGPGDDGQRLVAFAPVQPTDITAVVQVVPLPTGTRLDVECQYGGHVYPDRDGAYPHYSIVVTDRDGRSSAIKEWPVSPGKVMHPSATTPLEVSQIRDVEIRSTGTDVTVLRAALR